MIQLTKEQAEKYNGFEFQKDCFVNVIYDIDENPFISKIEAENIDELKDIEESIFIKKEEVL
jgi:hypothetical protein